MMSRILIIEDEDAIRRVMVKIISEESDSYEVTEASNGLEGFELLKKEDFELRTFNMGHEVILEQVDYIKKFLTSI